MNYVLCSIYDRIAHNYGAPSCEVNKEVFMRKVKDLLRNDERFYANAADYELHIIGSFDSITGVIVPSQPDFICSMEDLKENV